MLRNERIIRRKRKKELREIESLSIQRKREKDLREFKSLKMDPLDCLIGFLQISVKKFEKLNESESSVSEREGY